MVETYLNEYDNPLGLPDIIQNCPFSSSSNSYMSGVDDIVDAFSLCLCLWTEMKLRKGLVKLDSLEEHVQKVFKSDPKKKKVSPLDLEFV